MKTKDPQQLAEELEKALQDRFGPAVSGKDLWLSLGYRSGDAFRQALSRGTVPVPLFELPNRRGKFALVKDVAAWLAEHRAKAQPANTKKGKI